MSLPYAKEHLNCLNYDGQERAAISLHNITPDNAFKGQGLLCKIVFVLKGEVLYSCGELKDYPVRQGQILFILPGSTYSFTTGDEALLLVLRPAKEVQFCEFYQLETLMSQALRKEGHLPAVAHDTPFLLTMNNQVESYVSSLTTCISQGLCCYYYFDMKIRELFYLFRAFYTKEDLAMFFRDAAGYDTFFSHYILNNHHKYNNVSALASAMNTSLSSFEKRFKKVFGQAPYKWMTQQKAKRIYHALNTEDTPLKELSLRFGFANKSTFNDFCKKNLQLTPAAIRNKKTNNRRDKTENKNAEIKNRK